MPSNPAEAADATHLGWVSSPAQGGGDADHLVLNEPWAPTATGDQEPVVTFTRAQPIDNAEIEADREPDFTEVNASGLESPFELWGAEPESDDNPQSSLVVFGENSESVSADTVFS
jgi:hypothetical protein